MSSHEKTPESVSALIEVGILKPAIKPADNQLSLHHEHYSIPLIEDDYSAKTPVMWNAAYREFGMDSSNVMMVGDVKNINDIFEVFRKDEKYVGGGAGVGFKDEVIPFLDEIDPLAEQIGAVNLVMKTLTGKLRGYNTDGLGYVMSLNELMRQNNLQLIDKKVVMLGSGGTGNAISFELVNMGAQVVILNRKPERAEALAYRLNSYFKAQNKINVQFGGEDMIATHVTDADVVINVSTKGATGHYEKYNALAEAKLPEADYLASNLSEAAHVMSLIPPQAIISDIVLRDDLSPLMKMAKENAHSTLGGVGMVVYQGVEAFWLIHSQELETKGYTKDDVSRVMKQAANF